MQTIPNNQKIHYTLRVAAAMCFVGHGAFGIITKPIWCNYFALFGIDQITAYRLMPVTGCIDIILGIILLFKPVRAIAAWLVVWGIVTALCRPFSGEPFAEFIERTGNFGAPLCLLLLAGNIRINTQWLFSSINPSDPVSEKSMAGVKTTLRLVVFGLLAGHGWLNLLAKPSMLSQYTGLGFSNPANTALIVGIFEITAAIAILVRPARPLILIFLLWKMGTELFYPHFEILEWVERGGSYGTLLALWFCLEPVSSMQTPFAGGVQLMALPFEALQRRIDGRQQTT